MSTVALCQHHVRARAHMSCAYACIRLCFSLSRYGMGTGICPSGQLLKLLGLRPLSFVLSCLVRGEHTGCRSSRPRRRPRRRAARARRAGGRTSPRRPRARAQRTHRGAELGAQNKIRYSWARCADLMEDKNLILSYLDLMRLTQDVYLVGVHRSGRQTDTDGHTRHTSLTHARWTPQPPAWRRRWPAS